MKIRRIPIYDRFKIGMSIIGARFFNRSIPLLVGWSITDRCQLHCPYCGLYKKGENDLGTTRILEIIDELFKAGCRRIQFTGGEPLLRDDIGEVLVKCKKLGIATSISTNGLLAADRVKELSNAGQVNLSVDGPADVQDEIRGEGSFRAIKNSAEVLQKNKIPIRFASLLHAKSLSHIDFLLGFAANYETLITFQPITHEILGTEKENPMTPDVQEYRKGVDHLMKAHKKGAPIGNSIPGLRHMIKWPDPSPTFCVGGKIFIRIEADGGLVNCQRRGGAYDGFLAKGDIKDSLSKVKAISCDQCWSAPVVEASCIMQGKISSILYLNRTM